MSMRKWMTSSLNWKAKDGVADGAHSSFWHWDWDTTQTGKHPNIERGSMSQACSYRKGPNKADLNCLCLLISCTACETDTDLCANTDFHEATVTSRHSGPFSCTAEAVAEVIEIPAGVSLLWIGTCLVLRAGPITQLWVVLPSNGRCQNWRPHLISRPWPWSCVIQYKIHKNTLLSKYLI